MTLNQRRIIRLGFFEEVAGDLSELTAEEYLIAKIGKLAVELPLDMQDTLHPFLHMRVAVLHTDIPGKEYLVRCSKEAPAMDRAALSPTLQTAYEGVRA